jgi:LysR family nitrogen assimilation transcriptional regulator
MRFFEGLGTHMLSWLAAGDIDIAVFYLPTHTHDLKVNIVLREDVRLVAPPDHRHIGTEFSVRYLDEVLLILPSTPDGLRLLAASLAERAGITLNVAVECDASTSVTKRMVLTGSGCKKCCKVGCGRRAWWTQRSRAKWPSLPPATDQQWPSCGVSPASSTAAAG